MNDKVISGLLFVGFGVAFLLFRERYARKKYQGKYYDRYFKSTAVRAAENIFIGIVAFAGVTQIVEALM